MPLYMPLPVGEVTFPCEKVALWDSGMMRVRSGEPLCAKGWCSKAGEGEVEGGPEGVVAGVGGRGGGVESLRLLLLLLLVWVDAGSSELWPNSSSSSREILRYGVSEPGTQVLCSCLRPMEELRESVSELPSCDASLRKESRRTTVTTHKHCPTTEKDKNVLSFLVLKMSQYVF